MDTEFDVTTYFASGKYEYEKYDVYTLTYMIHWNKNETNVHSMEFKRNGSKNIYTFIFFPEMTIILKNSIEIENNIDRFFDKYCDTINRRYINI